MKILHCITGLNVGGAEIMLFRYLRGLGERAQDHSVLSLMEPGEIGTQIAQLGVSVHSAGQSQGAASLTSFIRVRDIIKDISPDIVHGWMYHGNFAASLTTLFNRSAPKVVWGMHHSLDDPKNESMKLRVILRISAALSSRTAGITYCSTNSQAQHEAVGFKTHNTALIPNAVDIGEFRPDVAAKARLAQLCAVPESRILLGNIARDHPMKDQASLVRATADLLSKGWDVQAVIIGRGHGNGQARMAAAELGIDDRVTTFESRSDIPEIVPGLDIFVLSSAWGEAFPLSVGEAMAASVPVVVTDVGDSGYLAGDGGIIVQPADHLELSRGIETLLKMSAAERAEIGKNGRNRVTENFSMEGYIHAHDEFYARALAGQAIG